MNNVRRSLGNGGLPGVIPFTIPAKDQTILKIDTKVLHEQKTA